MKRPQSSSRKARDRGSVAVEFALVVPALLLIVFGLIDFGRALNAQISLTGAAREGARLAALGYSNAPGSNAGGGGSAEPERGDRHGRAELPARRRADRRRGGRCQLFVLVHHPDRRSFQLRRRFRSGRSDRADRPRGHAVRDLTASLRRLILARLRRDERGVVAAIVAILLGTGVLLGMGALVIDVGQIYQERAELQNGADAAALAVAKSCALGACAPGVAGQQADGNASNLTGGTAGVQLVCGSGSPAGLPWPRRGAWPAARRRRQPEPISWTSIPPPKPPAAPRCFPRGFREDAAG